MSADFSKTDAEPLIRTVEFLCGRGNFGYAELDENYRCLWRHGELASWISPGVNVCQQTDLFFGLEKELLDLQDEHGRCITLPRVGIPGLGNRDDKISVEIYWDDAKATYHVVIHRLVAESEVELELLKQIRARRLAEENFQTTRETLARKQMLLDIIMDHLPVATAIFDERKRFLFATRRWAHDFHIEYEPLIGQGLLDASPDIPHGQRQRLEETLAGLTTTPCIDSLSRGEPGAPPGYRWTHKIWTHPENETGGALTVIEDVSELASQTDELKAANDQLRVANKQLAQFASILSHDLSGPLRSLAATLDKWSIAKIPEGEEDIRSWAGAHIDRMKSILAGMNDYMQVLCFEPVARTVNIGQMIWEIVRTLPGGQEFNVSLALEVNAITVNPGLLDLVLRNLVENAIKHHDSESGHIRISVQDRDDSWLILLDDDGPGIETAKRQSLLEGRFEDPGPDIAAQGGKGLPIVLRALRSIGGTLRIESDSPRIRGTRFLIRWPKQPAWSAGMI